MIKKSQDTELAKILEEVEKYLKQSGMMATRFGVAVINNSALLTKMRRGAGLYSGTMTAIRKYIKDHPPSTMRKATK